MVALVSLLLSLTLCAQTAKPPSAATRPGISKKAKAAKPRAAKTEAEIQAEQTPAPPPTPAQMPPTAPQVSYNNGQLTIQAQNASLAEVLASVRKQTGASVEAPPMAASERVFGRFGPASPQDVLADLLGGSKFDFILLAPPDRPEGVQYVKLTPKRGGPPTPASPAMASGGAQSQQPDEEEVLDEEIPDEGMVEETPAEVEQPQPAQVPGQVPQGQPVPGQAPPQPGQQQQQEGVKTPEQLLQELQRLQQQQQQQIQEQLNPANRIPPNTDPNNPDRNPPEGEQQQQQPE